MRICLSLTVMQPSEAMLVIPWLASLHPSLASALPLLDAAHVVDPLPHGPTLYPSGYSMLHLVTKDLQGLAFAYGCTLDDLRDVVFRTHGSH